MIRKTDQIKKSELGFTLIEVMIVIIMLGVLAAIARPIYNNYIYKARTAEAVSALGSLKTFLMERRNSTGDWPSKPDIVDFSAIKELYYFDSNDSKIGYQPDPNGRVVTITLNPTSRFDPPGSGYDIFLKIDLDTPENGGWGGKIVEEWADHLPPAPGN